MTANTSLLPEFMVPTRGPLELVVVGLPVRKPSDDQQFKLSIIIAIATARCAHLQDDSIVLLLLLQLAVLFVFWGGLCCVGLEGSAARLSLHQYNRYVRIFAVGLSFLQTNEHTPSCVSPKRFWTPISFVGMKLS